MKNTSTTDVPLFKDPTRLLLWGNTSPTGYVYVPVTVYGRITAAQDVPSYGDTVLATISF